MKKLKKKGTKIGNKSTILKTRNYSTIVYPESAPENWLEIARSHLVTAYVSPLHDKDTNPTGEPKKPHYHVLYTFDNTKTPIQARALFEEFGGVGCEIVNSLRGMARYLCHLDNPEKVQYSTDDVITLGAGDYNNLCTLTLDKYRAIKEMMAFCLENKLYSFSRLSIYASEYQFDWFRILCDCGSIFMKEFLKSLYRDNIEDKICDTKMPKEIVLLEPTQVEIPIEKQK